MLSIEGEDLTLGPLLERKRRLLRIMPTIESRVLDLDHLRRRGCDLFRVANERDPTYSQIEGRHELFERRRHLLDRGSRGAARITAGLTQGLRPRVARHPHSLLILAMQRPLLNSGRTTTPEMPEGPPVQHH